MASNNAVVYWNKQISRIIVYCDKHDGARLRSDARGPWPEVAKSPLYALKRNIPHFVKGHMLRSCSPEAVFATGRSVFRRFRLSPRLAREHQLLEGDVLRLQLAGDDVEPMDRAGLGGQDEGVGLHLVGPALGVLAGGGGDRVDGAVGIHVHGRMGRQMALRVQDELVLGPQAQGDGGRLRAGIRHERLIGAGPLGIGETGLVSTQKAAGRAKEGGRQEGKEVFHCKGFLQR